jgi:hypothetical protein
MFISRAFNIVFYYLKREAQWQLCNIRVLMTHVQNENEHSNSVAGTSLHNKVTSHKLDALDLIPVRGMNFSLRHYIHSGSRTHPAPSEIGTGIHSQGIKRTDWVALHSPPCSAEGKPLKTESVLRPTVSRPVCLRIKHQSAVLSDERTGLSFV